MKLTWLLILVISLQSTASVWSQTTSISLKGNNTSLQDLFISIENQTGYRFFYNNDEVDVSQKVTIEVTNKTIGVVLNQAFKDLPYTFKELENNLILVERKSGNQSGNNVSQQQIKITGKVTDSSGGILPGVAVVVKGTTQGTVTDVDGNYSLPNVPGEATLVFSFMGMKSVEIEVAGSTNINLVMEEDAIGIEEVVAIGYGTMKRSDLTGAVTKVNMDNFRDQSNVSLVESLHGSVAGLNVSQVNEAGSGPSISIRGRTSISGAQNPLIILDGVIFRGSMIDINPNDIESIDILKDNSAAAVYGSQAANGVIIISTVKASAKKAGKPLINFTAKYSMQTPTLELKPGDADYFVEKISENVWQESRTAESGYTELKEGWDVTPLFKTNDQVQNYLSGMDTDWYGLLTNNNIFINEQNLSISNQTENVNYFASVGYTDQQGYMINEGFERTNARINIENKITDRLTVGLQAFASVSDYSGVTPNLEHRYIMPFEAAYIDGEINPLLDNSSLINPLMRAKADNKDIRQNLFGNIYASYDIPFIKGLTYRINVANNQVTNRYYIFEPYAENSQGSGSKFHSIGNDMSIDHNLTYKHRFNENHKLEITLVYGLEDRKYDDTRAGSSVFVNDRLGYNQLEAGSSELQKAESAAWKESSLFAMSRVFYSFKDKYLFTGTFRRDGFSGFSEDNKFGYFPSGSVGWVASEEPFFKNLSNVMNYMKIRGSYGSSGNRTIGRYQTLAKVSGGYNYVDASGTSIYTQSISSLASPNLKWETTTGINLGIDFGFLNSRIHGSVEYYNNNTKNLLYVVDIPSIGRFDKFPDNLGRIHNSGIEFTISTSNVNTPDFKWTSDFTFSRNRDELKKLLGADNDGDGKEDDLISERLFIGHPLNTIYDYQITGEKYQLDDEIPTGYDYGTNVVVDQNDDGKIDTENDKIIVGYNDPSYRFSITNNFQYKNWSLSFFINSVQGGKNYYMAENDVYNLQFGDQYNLSIPHGYDNYWLPENPGATYQKKSNKQTGSLRGKTFAKRNFIRLQDVSLSYRFKRELLEKIKVSNLRVFFSGKNLLTLTNWEGWDPETGQGITRGGRPVLRSYTIGLNLEF
ncbi:TonB-dependent receptor [Gaoshiqia sediminis]|uniref:TonB-dependent receptor n=1 Tax=Gaoshiqia sediminis TaxID=2986998 RepID=A0AA41Y6U9_9BACT|nr:TonB-dependent receptor [Gaoshiqia sediminis]MCW0484499.1 TonB-dependent receptor [Gaoshiqia sediminis]